jgi:hypothetical protein
VNNNLAFRHNTSDITNVQDIYTYMINIKTFIFNILTFHMAFIMISFIDNLRYLIDKNDLFIHLFSIIDINNNLNQNLILSFVNDSLLSESLKYS